MSYVSTCLNEVFKVERIITIHYFEYMKNFSFPGETHDFWELVCVDRGEAKVEAGDKIITLHKGDCIFHKPMEFHSVRAQGNISLNLVVISFECASTGMNYFAQKLFHLSDGSKVLLSNVVREAKLSFSNPIHIPSVEQVIRSENAPFGSEQLVKLYLELFLINMVREDKPVSVKAMPILKEEVYSDSKFEKIIQYLELHISECLTLKIICNDNLLGRTCLQNMFHKEVNCGAIEYFINMKINVAKQIICDGTKNFSEISDFLGYSSLQYFSRQFKQITGMSPKEYESSIKHISGES